MDPATCCGCRGGTLRRLRRFTISTCGTADSILLACCWLDMLRLECIYDGDADAIRERPWLVQKVEAALEDSSHVDARWIRNRRWVFRAMVAVWCAHVQYPHRH